MTVKNTDLIQILTQVNKLKNQGVSTEGVQKVLNFHKGVAALTEQYSADFKQLMKDMNVEEIDENYNWSEHENQDEITEKVKELLNKEVEIKTTAITTKDLVALTNGMSVGEVTYLKQYLQEA